MKNFKEILKETNVSGGIGIRGLGNVTGEPAIDDDNVSNYIQNNQDYTNQLKSNMTDGMYGVMDDNWWMDKKEIKAFPKKGSITGLALKPISKTKTINEGMEKDHYKAIDDVHVNLDNRNHAIDEYGYGPLNPQEKNTEFWKDKADLWKITPEQAKTSRCYNCAAFNKSKEITDRISNSLGPAGKKITELADLGFCEMFHFKCASSRTCDAWLSNGPIKEEAPTVNAGGIAGSGDERLSPSQREPGVPPKTKYKKENEKESPVMSVILKRNALETNLAESPENNKYQQEYQDTLKENTGKFAGKTTHKVPRHVFTRIVQEKAKGKHWKKYLGDDEVTGRIREYAMKNPKKPIIIEDETTGYMCFAKYGA